MHRGRACCVVLYCDGTATRHNITFLNCNHVIHWRQHLQQQSTFHVLYQGLPMHINDVSAVQNGYSIDRQQSTMHGNNKMATQ